MDKELLKILKELKHIQPDPIYSSRSRSLILATKPEAESANKHWQWFSVPKFTIATVIAIVFFLITCGGVYYFNKLSQDNLVVKAGELNTSIQIKLNELKYLLENDQINSKDASTIQALLEQAANDLKQASELSLEEKNLEELLQKLKSAQEALIQIDSLLKK